MKGFVSKLVEIPVEDDLICIWKVQFFFLYFYFKWEYALCRFISLSLFLYLEYVLVTTIYSFSYVKLDRILF